MRAALACCALLLAACGAPALPWSAPPAAAIDLKLAIAPTTAALMQPIVVTIDRWRAADVEVEFAPQVDGKDFLCTTTVEPEVDLLTGRWQRTVLQLRPRRGPGELTVPSFVAKAKSGAAAASTPEQIVTVTSSLAGHGGSIEVPGEPFPTPFAGWWWLGGAAALASLLAAMWLFARRRRGPSLPVEVALPAHVKALRALQRLRQAARTTPAEIESFYVEVSQVLRVYLEERFGVRAPERTTEEFLREVESSDALLQKHRRELERFLSQCDLVKFAAVVPGEGEHMTTFAVAEAFVESTRPDRAMAEVGA
jgi:hypothetical protein